MQKPLRTVLLALLMTVVVGILVYRARGSIRLEGFSWDRLTGALRRARHSLVLLSVAANYGAYALRAQRWARLSRHLGRISFPSVYSSTLIGFFAIFLFGRLAEPIRPLLIARKDRVPVSGTFGIYILERVLDTASTLVLAGLSLLLVSRSFSAGGAPHALVAAARTTGIVLLAGMAAAVAALVYLHLRRPGALESRQGGGRAARVLRGFSEGLQAIRSPSDLAAAIGYSAAHWLLVAYIYLWVPHSFGGRLAELDFPAAVLLLGFTMVGSTLQLPGIGVGSQVACFLALTGIFGVEKEPAAAAAVVLWLVQFGAVSFAGVPLLIKEGWSLGELRRLARAEAEAKAAGTHITLPDVSPRNRSEPSK